MSRWLDEHRDLLGLVARAAPGEDLLRPKALPTGDLGNDCVRPQRLRDDPRLVIHRPMTPTAGTIDHLETPKMPLRVKRKVKSRHKPISDPNTASATSQIATTPERWSRNTAYIETVGKDFFNRPTRHLCQVALSTLVTAALRPSCASEMMSLTPLRGELLPALARCHRLDVQVRLCATAGDGGQDHDCRVPAGSGRSRVLDV